MRMIAIHNALRAHFADIFVLPAGNTNIVTASNSPLIHSPQILAARLAQHQIHTELVSPNFVHYLYTNDRYREISTFLGGDASINADDKPIFYPATVSLWLSMFFPDLAFKNINNEIAQIDKRYLFSLLMLVILVVIAVRVFW